MKKKITIIAVFVTIATSVTVYITAQNQQYSIADITLANIEALADNESGGGSYSCTATTNCYDASGTNVTGSVSCTGQICSRGVIDGGFWGEDTYYVECDGHRTVC